jgi:hypothetical protein
MIVTTVEELASARGPIGRLIQIDRLEPNPAPASGVEFGELDDTGRLDQGEGDAWTAPRAAIRGGWKIYDNLR